MQELGDLVIAKELAHEIRVRLHPEDNLLKAFEAFGQSGLPEIPVVHPDQPDRLLGILERSAALAAYLHASELPVAGVSVLVLSGGNIDVGRLSRILQG